MREVVFLPPAWNDLGWWVRNDLKTVKKIYSLLENAAKTPFEGLGQPEGLKGNYQGYWSRRINLEDRLIYKVEPDRIVVVKLLGHYML